jgi:hypothetical protein
VAVSFGSRLTFTTPLVTVNSCCHRTTVRPSGVVMSGALIVNRPENSVPGVGGVLDLRDGQRRACE